jgi:hypothetical protein
MDYCHICNHDIRDYMTHMHSAEHQDKARELLKRQQGNRAAAIKKLMEVKAK